MSIKLTDSDRLADNIKNWTICIDDGFVASKFTVRGTRKNGQYSIITLAEKIKKLLNKGE